MSTPLRVSRFAPRLALVLALAGLALVVAGAPTIQGADPFVAGGRSTRTVALPASQVDRAIARGRQLATVLGLPGIKQRVARLDDRFEHRTYDEVTSLDSAGRDVAIARIETDGTLAMALVLGWQAPRRSAAIDRTVAEARGLGYARAAGLVVGGRPTVVASSGAGGWSIRWPRLVGGAPVRGDGVRIALWADGSFHGLTRIERPLAAVPAHPLTARAAGQAAEAWVARQFGAAARDLRLGAVERAWVAPNDTFAPNGLAAPAETLRLAWIARFDGQGTLAGRLRSIEVWLDAGDGSLLGGDAIE